MQPLRAGALVTAGAAVLALLVVQFVPWATHESQMGVGGGSSGMFGVPMPTFQLDMQVDALTWSLRMQINGDADSQSWYDAEFDGEDGIGAIRTAVPLLLVGAVLVLAGGLAAGLHRGAAGGIVTLAGVVALVVATVLFSTGVDALFDAPYDWGASLYLAITSCTLALAAGVLALLPQPTRSSQTAS